MKDDSTSKNGNASPTKSVADSSIADTARIMIAVQPSARKTKKTRSETGSKDLENAENESLTAKLRGYKITPFCVGVFSLFLFFFLTAMQIAIMVKKYASGVVSAEDFEGGFLGLHQNLNSWPFSDITLATECPSGYEALNLGNWPGTAETCVFKDKLYPSFSQCPDISPGIEAKSYVSWKNMSICAQRVSGFSNSTTCPAGYTQCYTGVCIQGTECGVTEVYIEESERTTSGWYSNNCGTYYVNYRKDADVLPIVTLAISQGKPELCVNPNEYTAQINYAAIAVPGNGCGRYGNFLGVSKVDNDTSLEIFYAQKWTPSPVDLPLFTDQIGDAQTGYLLSIPRLDISNNDECTTLDVQKMLEQSQELQTSGNITAGFSITIILLLGSLVVYLVISYLTTMCAKGEEGFTASLCRFYSVVTISAGILLIPVAIITSVRNTSFHEYNDIIDSVISSGCFKDPSMRLLLDDLAAMTSLAEVIAKLWTAFAVGFWPCFMALIAAYFVSVKKVAES